MTLPQINKLNAEALLERFNAKDSQIEQQRSEIEEGKAEIAQLLTQIDYLKRKLYGSGDGESTDKLQMELTELLSKVQSGAIQAPEIEEEVEVPEEPAKRRKRKPLRPRSKRYENLPVKETIEIIPEEVLANPDAYERIDSVEETFEIDFNQIEFYRRAIIRPKFRPKAAGGSEAPVVASAPVRLSGGLASAHLIALIVIAKYWDHLPLHRQASQYKRYGCEFSQESMVRWVARAGEWLEPIHRRMRWELLQGNYVQVDETPMTAPEIKAYRQKHVAVKWKWLGQLIRSQARTALPKSPMGKACTYAINNWQYLSNYLEHGEVQIDNNLMENCIRPTKIGAKNWLFIGHPDAGQRSAIIYSVLISCRRLGVDPDAYLSKVFAVDTANATEEQIAELTPKAFAERQKSETNT